MIKKDIPVIPPIKNLPPTPNSPVAKCGECGIELYQVMGYVCLRDNCPCFPKATY